MLSMRYKYSTYLIFLRAISWFNARNKLIKVQEVSNFKIKKEMKRYGYYLLHTRNKRYGTVRYGTVMYELRR